MALATVDLKKKEFFDPGDASHQGYFTWPCMNTPVN